MQLSDVMGVARSPPAATSRSPRSPTTTAASRRATLFFCVPGFTRDGHEFAPDAVARGAAALVVERPLGLGVPEVVVPSVRDGDGAGRGALLRRSDGASWTSSGSPARTARRRPRSSCARCWRRPGASAGCSAPSPRSSAASSGRWSARRPRRSTCSATSARCSTAATSRARWRSPRTRSTGPRRRDPLRGGDLHEPHAGPPRLPPDDGGLLPARSGALFDGRARRRRGRQRRRLRTAGGSRDEMAPPTAAAHVRDRPRGDLPRDRRRERLRRLDLHRAHAGGRRSRCATPLPGPLQRRRTCSARVAAVRALGVPLASDRRRAAAGRPRARAASSRSTRASRSRCWSTTRTRPTRWRTCCGRRAS